MPKREWDISEYKPTELDQKFLEAWERDPPTYSDAMKVIFIPNPSPEWIEEPNNAEHKRHSQSTHRNGS